MNTISHNWAEHVAFGARSTHFPQSLAEVQELVRQAEKVRVVGARHSFNAIADTPGALISRRALERLRTLRKLVSFSSSRLVGVIAVTSARRGLPVRTAM